ncbi:hypothetical protein N7495_005294 [Penicillium taxi]|uniref:uncharacterized protein n=1 Tax=Penicillium taxi TaxID=168475 RepID=UPI0025451587|nr:uncharacterized protein N7495_005294 [Penicillium taxi]KAJ5893603.1 hypothetical protein N7495_005294 [Penicillium taxi]
MARLTSRLTSSVFLVVRASSITPHRPRKGTYVTVMVDLVCPVSNPGEVTLNSANPLQQPNIISITSTMSLI